MENPANMPVNGNSACVIQCIVHERILPEIGVIGSDLGKLEAPWHRLSGVIFLQIIFVFECLVVSFYRTKPTGQSGRYIGFCSFSLHRHHYVQWLSRIGL